ncbi:hypothetical protein SOVF_019930, partial [Spinacia oleracea]
EASSLEMRRGQGRGSEGESPPVEHSPPLISIRSRRLMVEVAVLGLTCSVLVMLTVEMAALLLLLHWCFAALLFFRLHCCFCCNVAAGASVCFCYISGLCCWGFAASCGLDASGAACVLFNLTSSWQHYGWF